MRRHPEENWRRRLARLLTDEIRALGSYPGLGLHIAASIPVSENALACSELELGLLLEGGASRQQAGWAIALLGSYVANAAIEAGLYHEQSLAGSPATDTVAAARDLFAALPQQRFPLLRDMVDSLFAGDDDDRQRWTIEVLITGILKTAATPEHGGGLPSTGSGRRRRSGTGGPTGVDEAHLEADALDDQAVETSRMSLRRG